VQSKRRADAATEQPRRKVQRTECAPVPVAVQTLGLSTIDLK